MNELVYLSNTISVSLTDADRNTIEAQRELYKQLDVSHLHEGRPLEVGQNYAAVIVRVDIHNHTVDLRVLLPGTETPWLKDVPYTRLMSHHPVPEVPSPAMEVDRLWPYVQARMTSELSSGQSFRNRLADEMLSALLPHLLTHIRVAVAAQLANTTEPTS